MGELAASLDASLRRVDAALGGVGRRARGLAAARGPAGLTAGVGCGVAVGWGWGAGLMLKPDALASLWSAAQARLPPVVLEALAPAPASRGAGVEQQSSPPTSSAAPAAAAAPPGAPSSAVAADVAAQLAELRALARRQQEAIEEVQRGVSSIQRQLASGPGNVSQK